MVWDPTESVVVAPLMAVPPLTETAEPKFTPSIRNWTVPVLTVAVLGATPLTVAVNATGWPNTEGLADEETVVVVLARKLTVSVPELLPPVVTVQVVVLLQLPPDHPDTL